MSIKLNNLNKRYHKQAVVNDVSLEIEKGELFVLLGASGSGKSTILRMIAGLTKMDGGEIWLHERNVTRLAPQKRDTGFVFQNYSLFQHMNVEQNIAFGLSLRRVSRAEKKRRVVELLELIGLAGMEKRMPSQLSGGQQQRIALARALAHEPNVLLLDEPFGALDAKIRVQLRESLKEIQERLNVTTILVTHDQEEAFDLADRIGIIDHGQLLEVGTPDQLYHRPQQPFTANFLGKANLLPAQRNSHTVYVGETPFPAPQNTEHLEGQPVTLMVRPEALSLGANGTTLGQGVIEKISFGGVTNYATVQLQDPMHTRLDVFLTAEDLREQTLTVGQTVTVNVGDFHLLKNA